MYTTKQRILHAALDVFEESGFVKATTKEIAQRAAVSEGSIYKYYKSKDELLDSIADELIHAIVVHSGEETLQKIIHDLNATTFEEKIKCLALSRLKVAQKYLKHINVLFLESRFRPEIRERITRIIYENSVGFITEICNEARNKGEIKEFDDFIMIRSILGSLMILYIQREYMPFGDRNKPLEDEVDEVLNLIMNGIKK